MPIQIKDLKIEDDILITKHGSASASNRFIYYPDHLVRMPGPGQNLYNIIWSLITEPAFNGLAVGAAFEYGRPSRPHDLEDESVGSFLNRRLGTSEPANNLVSAVLHGIYAGDIYQLSIKSLLPKAWVWEMWRGSIAKAMIARMQEGIDMVPRRDVRLQEELMPKIDGPLTNLMATASVYSFKQGLTGLSVALERSLQANPNVQFKLNDKVTAVELDQENDGIKVCYTTRSSEPPDSHTTGYNRWRVPYTVHQSYFHHLG